MELDEQKGECRMANIRPRRRLSDLYAKGREVRFGPDGAAVYEHIKNRETGEVQRKLESVIDLERNISSQPEALEAWVESDDDIQVWLTPPNPKQREQALREATATRNKTILKAKKDEESAEAMSTSVYVGEMSLETLIEYVLELTEDERREEAQREILKKDEWKDFVELQDAMRKWDEAGNPHTDEWQPLIDRDVQFGTEVDAEATHLAEASRSSLELLSRDVLEKKGRERRMEMIGNQAFVATFERENLYYACRDFGNKDVPYWQDLDDMLSDDEYALSALADVYAIYIQTVRDAKNAPRVAPGSASSPPPEEPETSEASTPQEPSA